MSDNLFKITPLKVGGFPLWEKEMSGYLRFKKLWLVASGEEKEPTLTTDTEALKKMTSADIRSEKQDLKEWKENNAAVAGTISLALSPEERDALDKHLSDGVKLWEGTSRQGQTHLMLQHLCRVLRHASIARRKA